MHPDVQGCVLFIPEYPDCRDIAEMQPVPPWCILVHRVEIDEEHMTAKDHLLAMRRLVENEPSPFRPGIIRYLDELHFAMLKHEDFVDTDDDSLIDVIPVSPITTAASSVPIDPAALECGS